MGTNGLAIVLTVVLMSGGQTPGQKPAPAPATQKPAPTPAPDPTKPTIQPGYTYNPEGRRDPFVSLLGRGDDTKPTGIRPAGLAGLLIGEVTVKGTLRDRSGFRAVLQAPDNKSYIVRVGDRLMDGSVKAIELDKVVFSQDVNDPLSLVKQREVSKAVRQGEGRGQ
jgi:Tfp pilus assembly protein PilP